MHPNVAAVLVEPIQGEAGIVVPPEGYLRRLGEITKEHNALLIADEIQSGLGRTGKLFCFQHEGHPARRCHRRQGPVRRLLSGLRHPGGRPGDGGLHAGHPRLHLRRQPAGRGRRPRRPARAGRRGDGRELGGHGTYFMERLRTIPSKHIKEIRGKGLWIGIELHREAGGARRFCEALQKEGLLCKETHDHVIRLAPR